MAVETPSPVVLRFGAFELDLRSGELHKQGLRVKLQEQPFRVLNVLVHHPGEVVTRDELRASIWPADTFVDFDNSLNTSINKLREALGDSAESPRFIETLPRRGYRFVAPVTGLQRKRTAGAEARTRPWKFAIPVAALTVALLAGGFYWRSRQAQRLTEKDTIVLADFDNRTGDAVFHDALKQALAVELLQSPFLNVLSDRRVGETLGMMGRPINQRITMDVGKELCQRTGSKALLGGTISSFGSRYLVDLTAVACGAGDTLAKEQGEATSKEDVLKALSRASSSLRANLGESLPSVQKFEVPIEATTSSLEALKSYSMGLTILREKGEASSVPFLQRAIELDPNFPTANAALAFSYLSLDEPFLALKYATKAYQLRDRVSQREKLRITAIYFQTTGEAEKEAQTYELWTANYPRDDVPHRALGNNYADLGRNDKALTEYQEALRLEPNDAVNYANLGVTEA